MNLKIRFCTQKDEALWVSLNQEFIAFEVGDNSFWNDIQNDGGNMLKNTFQKALEQPMFIALLLIEVDDKPLGFANLMSIFSVWAGGKALILDDLYIQKAHQGKGIGQHFMAWLEDYAKENGYERLQFQSEFSNPDAHSFYEKLGYESENMYFYVKYLK